MIVQCRKCETRFRFDETLMEGDGAWVRCSRCRHVFFQDRPAGDSSATEQDIPSVRVSDARRTPDDRFAAVEERLSSERKTEISSRLETQEDEDKGSSVEIEKEPSFDGLETDLEKESPDGPAADSEKEEEAADGAEKVAGGGTGRRRWGRTLLKLIALILFVGIVAGSVYLYLFPEIRSQVIDWASPWLRGVPVIENLVGTEKSGKTVLPPVSIREARQRSVSNLLTGNLRVIEGVAVNQASYPLARIRVRLVISDAYDVILGEKVVSCGNILSDAELAALAEAEIQRELSIPQGSDFSNERIAPKAEIPFMIVFSQEQAGAIKTTMSLAGADRI